MAGLSCACNLDLGNTGLPGCSDNAKVLRKAFVFEQFDSEGNENKYDLADAIDEAFLIARLNDPDKSKRWYPLPTLDNVQQVRADDIVESTELGDNFFVQEGTKTVAAEAWETPEAYEGRFNSFTCTKLAFVGVDTGGNILANGSEAGFWKGIPIAKNTFRAKKADATATSVKKTMFSWTYARTIGDGDVGIISASDITANLLDANGLLDVIPDNASADSTTVITVDLNTIFGSLVDPNPVEGITDTDLTVFNETTAAPVTISGVVEDPEGSYEITLDSAQTPADVLLVSLSKDGFEMTPFTVTVP